MDFLLQHRHKRDCLCGMVLQLSFLSKTSENIEMKSKRNKPPISNIINNTSYLNVFQRWLWDRIFNTPESNLCYLCHFRISVLHHFWILPGWLILMYCFFELTWFIFLICFSLLTLVHSWHFYFDHCSFNELVTFHSNVYFQAQTVISHFFFPNPKRLSFLFMERILYFHPSPT